MNSKTMIITVQPLTAIFWLIRPCVLTITLLLTIKIFTYIFIFWFMNFNSFSMLLMIQPVTFIFNSIWLNKSTETVCTISFPFALINFIIRKSEFGITLCDSDIPIPFIYSAIIPRHLSFSMSEASFPKARVNGPCFVCVCAFNWSLVLIVFVLESFFCFFFLKVFLSFPCFQTDYFVLLSLNKSSNKRLNFNNHE